MQTDWSAIDMSRPFIVDAEKWAPLLPELQDEIARLMEGGASLDTARAELQRLLDRMRIAADSAANLEAA